MVFYIQCKKIEKDYSQLWLPGKIVTATGSGFSVLVKNEKYIVTNAHVVKDAIFTECKKINSDKRYSLTLLNIAYEIDLALLKVDDPDFWQDEKVSVIGTANRGDLVKVVGFPEGGYTPSITSGVISRVNISLYSKSIYNLVIQVDSAINPGNSGGPALNSQDEIIGVAFSHNNKAQNVCFLIPNFILTYYLECCAKDINKFIGICDLDINVSGLENPVLLEYYLPDKKMSGVLVNKIDPYGNMGISLKKEDVIYKIDDIVINNDATVFFHPAKNIFTSNYKEGFEKVPYWQLVRHKKPDEKLSLTIIRKKKVKHLDIILHPMHKKLVAALYKDINTDYLIYQGLIFTSLNYWHLYNKKDADKDNNMHLVKYINDYMDSPEQEIIILHNILQTDKTAGYRVENQRLLTINDEPVENLQHVYQLCFAKSGEFVKFEFENKNIIILPKTDKKISSDISKKYLGIDFTNGNYI
jgi:S1-C subfamily serine protease